MDIICRHCNATYSVADHKIPRQKAAATCKRCGNRIVIAPPVVAGSSAPAAASPAPPPAPAQTARHPQAICEAFPDLQAFDARRYRLDAILKPSRKGRYATRLNRLKLKMLKTVQPVLDRLMAKDEQVLCIAGGTAYYPVEIFFGNGFFTMLYNRYALVATDRRLVMVNTNHRMTKPAHYLFQVPYGDIAKVSRGLFRTSLHLKRNKGRRRIFNAMKMALTGELQAVIAQQRAAEGADGIADDAAEHLCPACFTALPAGCEACTACQTPFKTVRKAALRSLLLPGWGDWYLGHRVLGAMELAGSLIVWLLVLSMIVDGGSVNFIAAGFILLFYNGFDALLTCHMARKGTMLESPQTASRVRVDLAANPA